MLRSRCAIRFSFRLPFKSNDLVPIEDYRFTDWDSNMHHDHTSEEEDGCSLEVDTIRVSEYVIHRLIRSSSDGKLVEFSGHCPHGEFPHVCNFFKEARFANLLWNSQREVHQRFHEERMARIVEPKIHQDELRRMSDRMAASQRRLEAAERKLAEAKKRREYRKEENPVSV